MKTIKLIAIPVLFLAAISLSSCSKDPGFEGQKDVEGTVTYQGGVASGAIVSIAFDKTEATTTFDYSTVTDANGKYSFRGLNKGDYFIDATLTDNHGLKFETGGAHIEIGKKSGTVTLDMTLE